MPKKAASIGTVLPATSLGPILGLPANGFRVNAVRTLCFCALVCHKRVLPECDYVLAAIVVQHVEVLQRGDHVLALHAYTTDNILHTRIE